MKTLGLIGGMSWQSTVGYYQQLNQGVAERLGGLHSAKLLLASADFAPIAQKQAEEQWESLCEDLISVAQKLEAAGCDGVMICTNTMHLLADEVQSNINIPLLHIADATGNKLTRLGISKTGLLGTTFTMQKPFYKQRLRDNFDIDVVVPDSHQQESIHDVIYHELCRGIIKPTSAQLYIDVVDSLGQKGCEGIVMGCTEIGLLLKQQDVALPLIDTTTAHCEMGIEFLLS